MKFSELPIELQDIFIDVYNKEKQALSEQNALKIRQGELEKELSDLKAKCTSSYWYAKTRERREELEQEIMDICWKQINLSNQKINAESKIFKVIEHLYQKTA